jgi:nitrate/TMAO reductase-like tetraheme cytochrome c subunit
MVKLIGRLNLKDPIVRIKALLVLGAALIILLFMTVGAITLTSTPTFCSLCHEMGPDVRAWKASSHAEVTCYGCHSEGNIAVFVLHKVESLKEIYLHLSDSFEKPINGESHYAKKMSNEACERCHSLNRKVTSSPGVIINHKKHEEEGVTCVTCHNRVGHPDMKGYREEKKPAADAKVEPVSLKPGVESPILVEGKPYENYMEMRACMSCHTGAKGKGPSKCETCHPANFELKPADHSDPNWRPPVHAEKAKADMGNCLSCHKQEFCTDCHGVEMPHPEITWKNEHSKLGQSSPQSCTLCHPQAKFCDACHHDYDPAKAAWLSTQPGASLHMPVVREKGAEGCFKCHKPTYCARCHVRGEKLVE